MGNSACLTSVSLKAAEIELLKFSGLSLDSIEVRKVIVDEQ